MTATCTAVTVRVPAKVNLQLAVGPAREDGDHDLVNVFHAVSLCDEVTVSEHPERPRGGAVRVSLHGSGLAAAHRAAVPLDGDNLAAKAVRLVADAAGRSGTPVSVAITKAIPVAGGMAGGSADAAAALVAADALWDARLGADRLHELAARLGSDVPFALLGGTAVGTGRGEVLRPLSSALRTHWVFALSDAGLSTPSVFAAYDRMRPDAPAPRLDPALTEALAAGDTAQLAAALANDLQAPALDLRPDLARVLDAGRAAGAIAGIVSGSGPTCAFLAAGAEDADRIAGALTASGAVPRTATAHGDVRGARVVSTGAAAAVEE